MIKDKLIEARGFSPFDDEDEHVMGKVEVYYAPVIEYVEGLESDKADLLDHIQTKTDETVAELRRVNEFLGGRVESQQEMISSLVKDPGYVARLEARIAELEAKDDCIEVHANRVAQLLTENDSLIENSDSLEAANEVKNDEIRTLQHGISLLEGNRDRVVKSVADLHYSITHNQE